MSKIVIFRKIKMILDIENTIRKSNLMAWCFLYSQRVVYDVYNVHTKISFEQVDFSHHLGMN